MTELINIDSLKERFKDFDFVKHFDENIGKYNELTPKDLYLMAEQILCAWSVLGMDVYRISFLIRQLENLNNKRMSCIEDETNE